MIVAVKACLHLQFLVRFSSSDGCERVTNVQIRVDQCGIYSCRTFITYLLVHMYQKKKIALF